MDELDGVMGNPTIGTYNIVAISKVFQILSLSNDKRIKPQDIISIILPVHPSQYIGDECQQPTMPSLLNQKGPSVNVQVIIAFDLKQTPFLGNAFFFWNYVKATIPISFSSYLA